MKNHPFRLVDSRREQPLDHKAPLRQRPFVNLKSSFADEAPLFVPGEDLETAINTAIAVGEPLLVTGEPGTGKTQAAYYIAHNLGIEPVVHFQVKSESTALSLLYHFDTVRYFHDAHLRQDAELVGTYPERLGRDLSRLPYLGVLLKDHQDIEELKASGQSS